MLRSGPSFCMDSLHDTKPSMSPAAKKCIFSNTTPSAILRAEACTEELANFFLGRVLRDSAKASLRSFSLRLVRRRCCPQTQATPGTTRNTLPTACGCTPTAECKVHSNTLGFSRPSDVAQFFFSFLPHLQNQASCWMNGAGLSLVLGFWPVWPGGGGLESSWHLGRKPLQRCNGA